MQWLKQNPVLATGIFMPVLLVVLFMLASGLPKLMVDPPQYNFLFTAKGNHHEDYLHTRYRVVDSKLVVEYHHSDKRNYNNKELYLYDAKEQSVRKIDIDISNEVASEEAAPKQTPGVQIHDADGNYDVDVKTLVRESHKPNALWKKAFVKEFENAHIDPSNVAPDGYEFTARGYRSGGDLTGLFYRNRSREASIRKDGRVVRIPRTNGSYYYNYNTEFLGWVIPKGENHE